MSNVEPVTRAAAHTAAANAPDAIIAAVTGYGLPGSGPLPGTGLDSPTWRAVFDHATRDRVVPLLAGAIADGALPASGAQREQVVIAHEQAMRLCLLLERAMLATAARLERARVGFRVLKGPAVAHLDYSDPAQRAFGDIDLLVPSSTYDDAIAALLESGARRRYPEVRPGFDRRWGKGACLELPDSIQIDVHRTFVAGPFGLTIDLDELHSTDAMVTIGGHDLPVLDRESRFLHACFHAALGDRTARLVALRDVAQMILTTDLDRDAAIERARRWRADVVVARAIRLAWTGLGLEPTPWVEWAANHRPNRFQARALRSYTASSRSYATQVAAGISAVNRVPEKVAYVRALLLANREHVARHDGGYARRLHRAWRAYGSTRNPR